MGSIRPSAEKAYEQFVQRERERGLVESILSLMEWDESTYMPCAAAESRGEQKAYLAAKLFDFITDPALADLLCSLESSDMMKDPVIGGNVRWVRRQHDRYVKNSQIARRAPSPPIHYQCGSVEGGQKRIAFLRFCAVLKANARTSQTDRPGDWF